MKERWIVSGTMPERAIERLQKAGICVFEAKKVEKKQILFCINKKDLEKAFAIYPNMCYNSSRESVYTFTRVGAQSEREKKIRTHRLVGCALGIAIFFLTVTAFSPVVFAIDVVGTNVYQREIVEILETERVKRFAPYPSGKEEILTAKILSLPSVEFCSVQKRGGVVRVEVRLNAFSTSERETGDMVAPKSGVVVNGVALGGTLLKRTGERIEAGESLVGEYFITAEETKVPVTVVAKVKLLCVDRFDGETEESAIAQAILGVESARGDLFSIETEQVGAHWTATASYTLIVKKNM
ncbi:MAG: sporulation protein YqfD [Clostridia bacterium]|nr:sporulation protein YqfD [Clostridia bacterium]